MVLGAGLELLRDGVWGGAQLIFGYAFQKLGAAPEDTEMGAEEFVGRADEEVYIEGLYVDGAVGTVVDGIHPHPSAYGMGQVAYGREVSDCANGVGGMGDGDEAGFGGDQGGEGVHIEGAVFEVDGGAVDGNAERLEVGPRGDVGVVVEVGDNHFVAGGEEAGQAPAEGVGEGGHVGA